MKGGGAEGVTSAPEGMTIRKTIKEAREAKPSPLPDGQYIRWLNELEGQALAFLQGFEDEDDVFGLDGPPFEGYLEDADGETELKVPPPHDGIYTSWLKAKTDLMMDETERYNVSAAVFNSEYEAWRLHITRTMTPLQRNRLIWSRL